MVHLLLSFVILNFMANVHLHREGQNRQLSNHCTIPLPPTVAAFSLGVR